VSAQVDVASDNTGLDLPPGEFSVSSANWGWAGLEDGDGNTMGELFSAP